MIGELWRAQRRMKRKSVELRAKYAPQIQAAKKAKDSEKVASLENDWYSETILNNDDDLIRTVHLVRRAQKLDIPVPPKKNPSSPDFQADENWHFNEATGDYTLSDQARRQLTIEIRKEEGERFRCWARWVTQVIVPIISLLVALAALALGFIRNK